MPEGPAAHALSAAARKSLDAERHLAWVRFAIIAFNIATYYLVMDPAGTRPGLALAVTVTAGTYAVALVTIRPYERIEAMRSAVFTVLADSVLIFLWLSATGAAESPFVFLWWISLAAVAFRFGSQATLVATAAYVVLDVAVALQSVVGRPEVPGLLVRTTYIIFMGAVGSFMARDAARAYQDGSRALVRLEGARRDARRNQADRARWRALAEASLEGLALHRGGALLEVNHAMAEILGRRHEDLIGTQMLDAVAPESQQTAREALAGQAGAVAEITIRRPDGGRRLIEMKPHDTGRSDGSHVLAVRDVTDLKAGEAMKELAAEQDVQIRKLQAMDRFKTDFINTAAHELNTPLTPLMIQLKVLRRSIDEAKSEAHGRSVDILERNLKRLSDLVADMMDVARLQSGRLRVDPTPVDLTGLVRAELEVFGPMADEQGVEVHADVEDGLAVQADPTRAGQVLSNLLSNAFKFTGRGGRIDVVAEHHGDGARVTVRDTGIGLTPEQTEQLFEPFVKVHGDHTGGTGLGLYIARSLVDAMGGRITCRSDGPGQGASFEFWLPPAPQDGSRLKGTLPDNEARMNVLVTGASGLVGARLIAELSTAGHEVSATSRDPGAHDWPDGVRAVAWAGGDGLDLRGVDAVVNLAGASIGGRRWSRAYKQVLRDSRLGVTRGLVEAMRHAEAPPALVSASAVGYYGRWPQDMCTEDRPPGDDFLAHLARDWEGAAGTAPGRVVVFRFGHVLDGRGGLLERILPIYRARIGGPLGSGRQPMPWIHHGDLTRAILWAVEHEEARGPYNLVSPDIRPYKEFHKALEGATSRQLGAPVPGMALRIAVGGLAPYLTGGQQAKPVRLEQQGFRFSHEELDAALAETIL